MKLRRPHSMPDANPGSADDPLLELRNVSKTFLRPDGRSLGVLDDLTYTHKRGESVAVVGPSGCGKTTLIRVAARLLAPDHGEVRHAGQRFRRPPSWLGIVFQEYNRSLFPWLTLAGNVQFGLGHLSRRERRTRTMEALHQMGLAGFERSYPRELSGGMQQRAALARTLVRRPRLLLLDEPFGSLDALTRSGLQEFVASLTAELQVSVLLVTHDIDEAILLADRVLVMSERPARFHTELTVELPRPRNHADIRERPQAIELRRQILELLDGGRAPTGLTVAA